MNLVNEYGDRLKLFKCSMAEISNRRSQKCSIRKVFLKIAQNSQENICARVSFLIRFEA